MLTAGRTPENLARNDLGERIVASPAIASGRIFLRSDTRLLANSESSRAVSPRSQ